MNVKEAKKIADRERMLLEKAHRMREDAMREDDNVFDVAFEGMGNEEVTASATDVKARWGSRQRLGVVGARVRRTEGSSWGAHVQLRAAPGPR